MTKHLFAKTNPNKVFRYSKNSKIGQTWKTLESGSAHFYRYYQNRNSEGETRN